MKYYETDKAPDAETYGAGTTGEPQAARANGAKGGRPKTRFSPVFLLPDGEDFETNEDGDIINDRTRWSGGWFPTAKLATEVGIEYAKMNRLVFVGVC
jgi:hypothetical protein